MRCAPRSSSSTAPQQPSSGSTLTNHPHSSNTLPQQQHTATSALHSPTTTPLPFLPSLGARGARRLMPHRQCNTRSVTGGRPATTRACLHRRPTRSAFLRYDVVRPSGGARHPAIGRARLGLRHLRSGHHKALLRDQSPANDHPLTRGAALHVRSCGAARR